MLAAVEAGLQDPEIVMRRLDTTPETAARGKERIRAALTTRGLPVPLWLATPELPSPEGRAAEPGVASPAETLRDALDRADELDRADQSDRAGPGADSGA
jgi:hypothetical protein